MNFEVKEFGREFKVCFEIETDSERIIYCGTRRTMSFNKETEIYIIEPSCFGTLGQMNFAKLIGIRVKSYKELWSKLLQYGTPEGRISISLKELEQFKYIKP